MQKKLNLFFMSMLLIVQLISNGLFIPMTASATDNVATEQTPEQQAEAEQATKEAQQKAYDKARAVVNELFTDDTKTEIASTVNTYTFNAMPAYLEDLTDEDKKAELQQDIDLAQVFVSVNQLFADEHTIVKGLEQTTIDAANAQLQALQNASAESKKALADKIATATKQVAEAQKKAEADATQQEAEAKADVKDSAEKASTNEAAVKKVEKAAAKVEKKSVKVASVEDLNPKLDTVTLWTKPPKDNEAAKNGHDLFTPQGDNLSETAVNTGEGFSALYNWTLPKGLYETNKDYTLVFKTPSQFKSITTKLLPLTTTDGEQIGTYRVKGNIVTITLYFTDENKNIISDLEDSDMLGQFWVAHEFSLNTQELNKNEFTVIYDEDGNKTPSILVKQKQDPPVAKIIKKGEKIVKDDGTIKIKWTVDVNNTSQTNKKVQLVDTVPSGLTIETNTATMEKFSVSTNGTFTDAISSSKNVIVNNNTLVLGTISDPYRVTYYTTIANEKQTDTQTFTNKVTAKGLDSELSDTASVTIDFGKPLTKEAVSYSESKQLATWRISFNGDHKNVINGQVKDTFKSGPGFVAHQFEKITNVIKIDREGNEEVISAPGNINITEYGTDGVTFVMPDGTDQYIFEYTTKPEKRLTSNDTLGNSASFDKGSNNIVNTGDISINGRQGIGVKTGKVDFKEKTVKWSITLNSDGTGINSGTEIQDVFGDNQALIMTTDQFNNLKEAYQKATGDTEATFEVKENSKGFKITTAKKIEQTVSFIYYTNFDTSKFGNGSNNLSNELIVGKQDTNANDTKDSVKIPLGSLTVNNGSKTGIYNPKTKEITWTAIINYNLRELSDQQITDEWSDNQTYVPSSMKIAELTLNAQENSYNESASVELTPTGISNTGLKFTLPKNKRAYKVTYKTKVADRISGQTYTNKIMYEDNAKKYVLDAEVKPIYAEDSNPNSNMDLIKTGIQDGDYMHWRVIINAAQNKYLGKYIFQDTIDSNEHRFIGKDNVKISEVTVPDSDGYYLNSVTANGVAQEIADLNVSDDTLSFNFKNGLDKTYILEYDTLILKDEGSVSNEAKFGTESTISTSNSEIAEGFFSWSAAGAAATIKGSGQLKIKKVSPNGNPIKGISFNIYDSKGNLLENVTTNKDGIAETIKKYKFKEYKVEEVTKSATDLGYKAITNQQKYTLTNDVNTTETVKNNLTDDSIKSCEKVNLTIKNEIDRQIDKVEIVQGDIVKTIELDNKNLTIDAKSGEEPGEKTFSLPESIKLTDDYQVKLYIDGYPVIIKTKTDFKWDFKTYTDGTVKENTNTDCVAELTIKTPSKCDNVKLTVQNNNKAFKEVRVTVGGESKFTNEKGEVSFSASKLTSGSQITFEKSGYSWKETIQPEKIYDCKLLVNLTVDFESDVSCESTEITLTGLKSSEVDVILKSKDNNEEVILDLKNQIVSDTSLTFSVKTNTLTSDTGYTIIVKQDGYQTKTIDVPFIADCKVEIDLGDTTCPQFTVTAKDSVGDIVKNANATITVGETTVKGTTNSDGSITFDSSVSIKKGTKITISKAGYKTVTVTVGEKVEDCKLTVEWTLEACEDVTVTVTNGTEKVADANVTIQKKETNEVVNEEGTTNLKTNSDGQVTIPTAYAKGGYDLVIKHKNFGTEIMKDVKAEDCQLTIDISSKACMTVILTVENGEGYKVTVVDSNNQQQEATTITNKTAQISSKYANGQYDLVLSKVGVPTETIKNFTAEDCKVTYKITEIACDNTTIIVENASGEVTISVKKADGSLVDLSTEEGDQTAITTVENKIVVNYVVQETDKIIVQDGDVKKEISPTIIEDCHVTVDFNNSGAACVELIVEVQNVAEGTPVYLYEKGNRVAPVEIQTTDTNGKAVFNVAHNTNAYEVVVQTAAGMVSQELGTTDCKIVLTLTPLACMDTIVTVKDASGNAIKGAVVKVVDNYDIPVGTSEVTKGKGQVTFKTADVAGKKISIKYKDKEITKYVTEGCEVKVTFTDVTAPTACPQTPTITIDPAVNVTPGKSVTVTPDGDEPSIGKIIEDNDGNTIVVFEPGEEPKLIPDEKVTIEVKGYDSVTEDVPADCTGITITPERSCPDFSVIYNGPKNSTAKFQLIKIDGTTETIVEKDIAVVEVNGISKLEFKTQEAKELEAGNYKLIQTERPAGYYTAETKMFDVTEDICAAELTVNNNKIPPAPEKCAKPEITVVPTIGEKPKAGTAVIVIVDEKELPGTVNETGKVVFDNSVTLTPGKEVLVKVEGYEATTITLNETDCENELPITPEPTNPACEKVPTITIDPSVQTIPGTEVTVTPENGTPTTGKVSEDGTTVEFEPGKEPKLTPEETVTITIEGYDPVMEVVPEDCKEITITPEQKACAEFAVIVKDQNGEPLAGALVKADGTTISGTTNSEGKIILTNKDFAITQNSVLLVSKDGYAPVQVKVSDYDQAQCQTLVQLQAAVQACPEFTVKVTDKDDPIIGATVTVKGDETVTGTVNEQGEVVYNGNKPQFTPGTMIEITKEGFEKQTIVISDSTATCEIAVTLTELPKACPQFTVTVNDETGAVAGANVLVKGTNAVGVTAADGTITFMNNDITENSIVVVTKEGYATKEVMANELCEVVVTITSTTTPPVDEPGETPETPVTPPTTPPVIVPPTPGTPTDPGTDPENPTDPGTDPENPTDPGTDPENPTDPGTDPENPTDPGTDPEEPTTPPNNNNDDDDDGVEEEPNDGNTPDDEPGIDDEDNNNDNGNNTNGNQNGSNGADGNNSNNQNNNHNAGNNGNNSSGNGNNSNADNNGNNTPGNGNNATANGATGNKATSTGSSLLPQTGEQVALYSLIGVLLIGAAFMLFKRNRRKA